MIGIPDLPAGVTATRESDTQVAFWYRKECIGQIRLKRKFLFLPVLQWKSDPCFPWETVKGISTPIERMRQYLASPYPYED